MISVVDWFVVGYVALGLLAVVMAVTIGMIITELIRDRNLKK